MKKTLALLLAAIMLLTIVACAGNSTPPEGPPALPPDDGESAEAPAADDEPAPPVSADAITLSAILTGYGRYKSAIDDHIALFTAYIKDKLDVDVAFEIEYPQEATVLRTRLASGESPDIFNFHAAIDAPVYFLGGYLPDLSNEEFVDKLYEGIRKSVSIEGTIVGLPLESFVWSALYNKAMFSEYGLTPPNTLTELQHVIDTLNEAGEYAFAAPFRDPWFPGWASQVPFCAMAAMLHPDFYDRMDAGIGSHQEMADLGWLDVLDIIFDNLTPKALEIGQDDGLANFANGIGAMMVTGPWYSSTIMEVNPDFELGLFALPIDENPDHAVVMLAVSTVITASPDSDNYSMAVEYINYILNDNVTTDFFNALEFNQLAHNQDVDLFPWTVEGNEYVAQGRSYPERALSGVWFEANEPGSQMYLMGQLDRAGLVDLLDEAWANSLLD